MFIEKPSCKNSLSSRKLVFGVGVNDSWYTTKYKDDGAWVRCPFYKVWYHMLQRCYDEKFHEKNPTYATCSVDVEWHLFSEFRSWMVEQNWQGNQLDKDLLVQGNKVYSKVSCVFISRELNGGLITSSSRGGRLKLGVKAVKGSSKYEAACCTGGKQVHIGTYSTEGGAHEAYKNFKMSVLIGYAKGMSQKIREAVLRIEIPEY